MTISRIAITTLVLFLLPLSEAFAYPLGPIKVGGTGQAEIFLPTGTEGVSAPKVTENSVEMTLPGAELVGERGKLELDSPHALLARVEATQEKGAVRVKFLVNGSLDNLRNRIAVAKEEGGFRVKVQYPAGNNATLALLQEEQQPLVSDARAGKHAQGGMGLSSVLLLLVIFSGLGAAAFYILRFLKAQSVRSGSRKYLVEQLAYQPIGPGGKSGVGLVKVGREFVLVGVTAQQVTLLSELPKLGEDYQEDSKLERADFKHAVEEEYQRLKQSPGLTA